MPNYGVCEIVATIGVRSIFAFRSASRDTWFEVDGAYRRFSILSEAKTYAQKQFKHDLTNTK